MSRRYTVGTLLFTVAVIGGCAGIRGKAVEVDFRSHDGVKLAGTLALPYGATDPVPAVVLLHGAEAATRSFAYRMHANIFLERGIAVLLYDKRGAGDSEGDHEAATFTDLIEDGLAAVRFLRGRQEIDSKKLGLIGASQSGWLTPEIAERAGEILFVINKAGPCSSWRETVEFEAYHEILDERVGEQSAKQQAAVYRRIWDYYVSPSDDLKRELEATLAEWDGRKDSHLPAELDTPSAATVENIAYDPTPFLERGTVPIFYVYGSEDVNIPTELCVARLGELQRAGKPVSFHVFEDEGHELGGVGLRGYRFVKGYRELLAEFAVKHTGGER